jgi:CubicO group peptidase (beta-lactamase class C family)
MPLESYTAKKLWEPLGAEYPAHWITDGPAGVGNAFGGGGFNATLRDLGRFGQMMLQNGTSNGRTVVPATWVREATTPVFPETEEGGRYGYQYQWWTIPNSDAFRALGHRGQFIHVDPKARLVVVKLSYFPGTDSDELIDETKVGLEAIINAFSSSSSRKM